MNQSGQKTTITLASIVQRTDDQASAAIGDEIVLLSIEQGKYFGMDRVGSRIWELIEHPISVGDLTEHLQQKFEVEPDECERDVVEFLEQLAERNLLVVQEQVGD